MTGSASRRAHLLEAVLDRAEREPERGVAGRIQGGAVVWVTAEEFAGTVRELAKGLVASGVVPGDRVVLMARTRLEWVLLDYAVLAAGAVTVPVYESSSAEQVAWILADSGAVLAVTESAHQRALCDQAAEATGCREIMVIDDGGLAQLRARGEAVPDAAVEERLASLDGGALATIVYTSGTTGRPKGCPLTHGNLCANVGQALGALEGILGPDERNLLFLPLAHSLARMIWLAGFEHGIGTVFATDLAHLAKELPLVRPTILVGVPRVFEILFDGARRQARRHGRGKLFERAAETAVRWSQASVGGRPPMARRAEHAVWERLVYRRLRAALGGQLRFALSGGAPLGDRLVHFFSGAGIRIYEGYGLTEASPVLTTNGAGGWRPGTVGRPVPGTDLSLAADGEILARGPQVFGGYWHDAGDDIGALDEQGWLHTGDLGTVDADGFVRIMGRKKDVIVTSAGKNVTPAPLEDRLRAHPLIGEALVLGDGRPYVVALLALDVEGLRDWAEERGRQASGGTGDGELLAALQQAVDETNASVSPAESIRRFAVLPQGLSIEAAELTPTLKVRRDAVEAKYADVIAGLYPT